MEGRDTPGFTNIQQHTHLFFEALRQRGGGDDPPPSTKSGGKSADVATKRTQDTAIRSRITGEF